MRPRRRGHRRSPQRLQRRLHWLVALVVLVQYALQAPMRAAGEAVARGDSIGFIDFLVTSLHTWGGAAIGGLVIARLVLRRNGVALVQVNLNRWQAAIAVWHHRTLYVILLVMVASGLLHYYAGIDVAARWHEVGKWALAAAVAVHVMAALWHYWRRVD